VCIGPDNQLQDARYIHQSTSKYGHRLKKENKQDTNEGKIKESLKMPGVVQRVPGGLGSQIS
jgi:hypothetical protein